MDERSRGPTVPRPLRSSPALAIAALVLSAVSTGCASAGAGTPRAAPRTETLSIESSFGARGLYDIRTEASALTRNVPADPAAVWSVLPSVFEALEISTSRVDSEALVMGNSGFSVRRIEGRRMSAYVDCGNASGRPRADQYEVTVYLMVQLVGAADGSTEVRTFTDAYAQARGISVNAVHCVPRGMLARRLVELISERLGSISELAADTDREPRVRPAPNSAEV